MKPDILVQAAAVLICISESPAFALTLGEAVERAIHNDPTYLSAQADLDVSRERYVEALASLRPQISASASTSYNRRDYVQFSTIANTSFLENFNSNSVQLNLTQPLWHHADKIAVTQADLAVSQAGFQLMAANQDLLMRLAQSWFDIMQARDALLENDAKVQSMKQQWEQARRSHEVGVIAADELEDANSANAEAMARRAEAQSLLAIKQAELEQIIGVAEIVPPILSEKYALPDLGDLAEPWLALAESRNPTLLAAQRDLESARQEVRKQRAAHEPTLDLVASHGRNAQGYGLSGGQSGFSSWLDTVGMQFNMPLYAGGANAARVRIAIALQNKAEQDWETALRGLRKGVKQIWFFLQAKRAQLASAQQAVYSTIFALRGAESARSRGIKADADVLLAQQKNISAECNWRKVRYEAVLYNLKLKAIAGTLSGTDLSELDKEFDVAPR